MRFGVAAVTALTILTAACAAEDQTEEPAEVTEAAAPADEGAVRQAIDASVARSTAAIKAGDAAVVAQEYAPDAHLLTANAPAMVGHAAVSEGLKGWLSSMKVTDMNTTTTDVIVSGDLAVSTGTYTMSMQIPNGPKIDDKGKFVTVWRRQADGSWKIVRDIMNTDLPQQQ
jgi:uncharacterized protein (TIGR02246 family)